MRLHTAVVYSSGLRRDHQVCTCDVIVTRREPPATTTHVWRYAIAGPTGSLFAILASRASDFIGCPSRSRCGATPATAPRPRHAQAPSACRDIGRVARLQPQRKCEGHPCRNCLSTRTVRPAAWSKLDPGQALPARAAIEEAMVQHRCGIDTELYDAPLFDARARRVNAISPSR